MKSHKDVSDSEQSQLGGNVGLGSDDEVQQSHVFGDAEGGADYRNVSKISMWRAFWGRSILLTCH
jgi:hypothetical protein